MEKQLDALYRIFTVIFTVITTILGGYLVYLACSGIGTWHAHHTGWLLQGITLLTLPFLQPYHRKYQRQYSYVRFSPYVMFAVVPTFFIIPFAFSIQSRSNDSLIVYTIFLVSLLMIEIARMIAVSIFVRKHRANKK